MLRKTSKACAEKLRSLSEGPCGLSHGRCLRPIFIELMRFLETDLGAESSEPPLSGRVLDVGRSVTDDAN